MFDSVFEDCLGYQIPGSRYITLKLTAAIGYNIISQKRVTSLIGAIFHITSYKFVFGLHGSWPLPH